MKKHFSVGLQMVRHQGVQPFWTEREYKYQNLILNGFVVQREYPGEARAIPMARVDIYYDTKKGIGIKKIRGVEPAVWKEASKFLSSGERDELIKRREFVIKEGAGKESIKILDRICNDYETKYHNFE